MRRTYALIFLIIVFAIRYHYFTAWKGDPFLLASVGETVSLQGIVVEEPSPKETYTQLIVEVLPGTKILVYDDAYSKRSYGDLISFQGRLEMPENFQSENGRTFDYISYLAKDKIFYQMRYASVSLIAEKQGNPIKQAILFLKHSFIHSLDRALPYPESRLAAGLVVAGKYALPKTIQQEFIDTGTIQVVVLSGYNVTIIAEMMMLLLASLPKMWGTTLGALSIALFALAAGGSSTIIRATIMVFIALLGKNLHRTYNVGRALIVSAVLMLAVNPMLLVFDPSFQLSFLATFGLIYCSPIVERYLSFIPEKYNFRNIIASTIATQVFVTPFLLYLTGKVSLVALPANVLLFFITPITMLLSFTTGILGIFSVFLITPIRLLAFIFLRTMMLSVHIFASFSFASFSMQSFPLWCVALVYVGFAVIIFRFKNMKHKKREGDT